MDILEKLNVILEEVIEEAYPSILKKIPKDTRRYLSSSYFIGTNSSAEQISPEQATKKPYSTMLLIYIDSNGDVLGYGQGSYVNALSTRNRGRFYRRGGYRGITTRKGMIDASSEIWAIYPDASVEDRYNAKIGKRPLDTDWGEDELSYRKRTEKLAKKKATTILASSQKYIDSLGETIYRNMLKIKAKMKRGDMPWGADEFKRDLLKGIDWELYDQVRSAISELELAGYSNRNDQDDLLRTSRKMEKVRKKLENEE